MKAAPPIVETPYLTTRGAMGYLCLTSPSSLYYLINQQRLPHLRRGGRLLFDKRDLDAWLRGTDAVSLARVRRA